MEDCSERKVEVPRSKRLEDDGCTAKKKKLVSSFDARAVVVPLVQESNRFHLVYVV